MLKVILVVKLATLFMQVKGVISEIEKVRQIDVLFEIFMG
jgi:hypothetical protein